MSPLVICVALLTANSLEPGDHARSLQIDGRSRSYLVHVPKS